jgi:hypothetical protein
MNEREAGGAYRRGKSNERTGLFCSSYREEVFDGGVKESGEGKMGENRVWAEWTSLEFIRGG